MLCSLHRVQSPMSAWIDSIVSAASSSRGEILINSCALTVFVTNGITGFGSEPVRSGSTGARFANDGNDDSLEPFGFGLCGADSAATIGTDCSINSFDFGLWTLDFAPGPSKSGSSTASASPPNSCRYKTCSFTSAIKREISDILLLIAFLTE